MRWEISRAALAASRPDLVSSVDSAAAVLLEWRVDLHATGSVTAHASLFDPTCNHTTPLLSTSSSLLAGGCEPTWIQDGSMLHVDLPNLLMLSIRIGERVGKGIGALLYARTSLLADLGLSGGRYESATLAHQPAMA